MNYLKAAQKHINPTSVIDEKICSATLFDVAQSILLYNYEPTVRRVSVPKDGNCLFTSLGKLLDVPHLALRLQASELVKTDEPGYNAHIAKCGVWGTDLEISVISKAYEVSIHVITKTETQVFNPGKDRHVYLVLENSHFEPIILE